VFDLRVAGEVDGDAVALEDEVEVGEGGARVGDEDRRAFERDRQQRGVRDGGAHERAFGAACRVGGELLFGARFLKRRETRWEVDRELRVDFADVRFPALTSGPWWVAIFTSRDAPLALLAAPWVETVKVGLKGRLAQPEAANGADTGALVPWALEIVAATVFCVQEVGLNVNGVPSPPTVTLTVLTRSGTPSIICGSGFETTVTAAVWGLMWIAARTTMLPR
jgi:hypothetical protein